MVIDDVIVNIMVYNEITKRQEEGWSRWWMWIVGVEWAAMYTCMMGGCVVERGTMTRSCRKTEVVMRIARWDVGV